MPAESVRQRPAAEATAAALLGATKTAKTREDVLMYRNELLVVALRMLHAFLVFLAFLAFADDHFLQLCVRNALHIKPACTEQRHHSANNRVRLTVSTACRQLSHTPS